MWCLGSNPWKFSELCSELYSLEWNIKPFLSFMQSTNTSRAMWTCTQQNSHLLELYFCLFPAHECWIFPYNGYKLMINYYCELEIPVLFISNKKYTLICRLAVFCYPVINFAWDCQAWAVAAYSTVVDNQASLSFSKVSE